MKISREETSPREVVLSIELESDELEPYLDRSFRRVVNKVQVPGFRPGKAPRWLVENQVGKEGLIRDSLDLIVQESLDKALKEESLESFGEPNVEELEIEPLSFKAVVPLEPIADLGDFRSLRLEPETVEVTEEQVERAIELMRYDAAPWEPADRPVTFGDLVTMDVDGFIDDNRVANDRGVDFIPTQDNPLPFPGFSENLARMERDESKEFTIQIPEDHQDNTIAGKECSFTAKVLEIKTKALPEIDDEFAKGVGDGYDSLEALRSGVQEKLREQLERAAGHAFEERGLEEVIKGASIEVSNLTTDREIDHLFEDRVRAMESRNMDMDTYLRQVGKSREEVREELRPAAQERLTRYLVVRKLAQEEGIEVSPEDIDGEVEGLTSHQAESGDALREALSSDDARSSIRNAILTRKVVGRLAQIMRGEVGEAETAPEEASVSTQEEPVEDEAGEESAPTSPGTAEASQSPEEGGSSSDAKPS